MNRQIDTYTWKNDINKIYNQTEHLSDIIVAVNRQTDKQRKKN